MNSLCCLISTWTICDSCSRHYCGDCWRIEGSNRHHRFEKGDDDVLKAYCVTTGKKVEWDEADKLGINTNLDGVAHLVESNEKEQPRNKS